MLPHLAQQPFADLETAVFIILLVLVGFLQEQNADCETENNNKGAYQVRQKEWECFENGAEKVVGKRFSRLCEDTAKGTANNGAVKKSGQSAAKT